MADESTENVAPHAGADTTGTPSSAGFVQAQAGHPASVHGVFQSTAFEVARNVLLLLALVYWLGLAHWVYRDARRRLDDRLLVATATALGLVVPYVGLAIYLLFRPPETLADVHAREIEVQALQRQIARPEQHCPVCRTEVEPGFVVCPVCTTKLKQPCVHCEAALDPLWQVCPYCATPVAATPPVATAELDAALTAEAVAAANGKPKRRAATRA